MDDDLNDDDIPHMGHHHEDMMHEMPSDPMHEHDMDMMRHPMGGGFPPLPPMPPFNMSMGNMGPNSGMVGPPGTNQMGPPGTEPPTHLGPPGSIGPPGTMGPPGIGSGPPGIGPGPPGMGSGPPGMGSGPPVMVSGPPGMGSGPPGMGSGPPGSEFMSSGPPGVGSGPPGVGSGPPGMGSSSLEMNSGPPGMGSGPPGMGSGPPGMGHGPPMLGRPPMASWGSGPDNNRENQEDNVHSKNSQNSQNRSNLPSLLDLKLEKPEELKTKKPSNEVILPKALEEALAFKDQRAAAVGSFEDEEDADAREVAPPPAPVISSEYGGDKDEYDDEDEGDSADEDVPSAPPAPMISKNESATKANKNKRKKKRKKAAKANRIEAKKEQQMRKDLLIDKEKKNKENGESVEVEYVQANVQFHELEPMYRQFHKIFELFKIAETKQESELPPEPTPSKPTKKAEKEKDQFEVDEEAEEKKASDEKERLSKRKLKKLSRLSVAELKQLVARPDVVEMYDVTAKDPKLLVQLKAHRNTVQVPRHWCYKRKYLQGKRGIEKPPFDLPDFIKKTGIMEMRASLQDKEEAKTLKAKMRERARPKLGKIDIDYQKLHDAFFKWQTKPRMTIHGDLYYEGKEFETRLREKKPGDLSDELRTALGMPVGPNCHKVPPPWLIAQQRYGPPPSYPNLKIAGLNAPIPDGCSFGYHAGGWGKPPVDEHGKPLYGDVFGNTQNLQDDADDQDIDRTLWGELESESEGESSEEESEAEEQDIEKNEALASGLVTPGEGMITPSGMSSVPHGLETPETIELRKKKIESDIEGAETPVLYHVLPEKRGVTGGMMASTHVYDINAAPPPPTAAGSKRGAGGVDRGAVELALDPSELELDAEAMAARYEQQLRAQQQQPAKEDLSDMLAEHVARQKSKRKRQQNTDTKQSKKYKEFKF